MHGLEDFYKGKNVLVTGGAGLIGSAFTEILIQYKAKVRTVQHRRVPYFSHRLEIIEGDLREKDTCVKACRGMDFVVNAAGVSGGSKNVTVNGISMFTDSLLINTQVIEAARGEGVKRFLVLSNSSVYAKSEAVLKEADAWGEESHGEPENETGMVKRTAEVQGALYAKETPMKVAIIRAGNAYGPRDNFDLESSHVVPALIRKAVSGMDPFIMWGSGDTVRDFIHSKDIANAGLFLLKDHADADPVNIATGKTITIRDLVDLILRLTGNEERTVQCDPNAPPASPAKRMDISMMLKRGFKPEISLEDGLRRTIAWYEKNCN